MGILERLRSNPQWDHTNDNREMRLDFRCQRTRGLIKKNCDGKRNRSAFVSKRNFEKKERVACVDFFDLDFLFCSVSVFPLQDPQPIVSSFR